MEPVIMRWFYWYAYDPKTFANIGGYGSYHLSDLDAWNFQTGIRAKTSPNVILHRFTWTQSGGWVRDTREDRELFYIPDVNVAQNPSVSRETYEAAMDKFRKLHQG
jgi:hypothetical protein